MATSHNQSNRQCSSRHKRSPRRRSTKRGRSPSQRSNSTEHRYIPSRAERQSINRMCFAIAEGVKERAEFTRFCPDTVATTATILVRFGIETFEELRSTRADQRSHFLADAKKSYRFKSMKMIHELFATFPPLKKGRNITAMDFNEIQITQRLKSLKLDLSSISGTLRPVQEMVNAISEEIARGEANPQSFHPYVIPNYHEHPWLPRNNAHITAYHTWKNKITGPKKPAISLQMWLHHHLRFVIAAEMCSLWTPFGGVAAQFNHIAVLLTLSTLESAGFAIRYHESLIRTMADYARARIPFDFFTALSEIHEDTRRAITADSTRVVATFPKSASKANGKGKPRQQERKKGKGQAGKAAKPSNRGKKGKNNAARATGKGPVATPTATPTAPA